MGNTAQGNARYCLYHPFCKYYFLCNIDLLLCPCILYICCSDSKMFTLLLPHIFPQPTYTCILFLLRSPLAFNTPFRSPTTITTTPRILFLGTTCERGKHRAGCHVLRVIRTLLILNNHPEKNKVMSRVADHCWASSKWEPTHSKKGGRHSPCVFSSWSSLLEHM